MQEEGLGTTLGFGLWHQTLLSCAQTPPRGFSRVVLTYFGSQTLPSGRGLGTKLVLTVINQIIKTLDCTSLLTLKIIFNETHQLVGQHENPILGNQHVQLPTGC